MDKTFKQKLEILPIKNIDHPVGNTKYYAAVHVKSLIAQADEEFQELLDKYSNLNDHYEKEVIKSSKLESQIANLKSQLQQQALPVVPEFVGEWIEHCKGMGYGLIAALTFKLSSTMHEELSAKILKWLGNEGNDETFALAFITGKYQVEKPQLFYLKNKLTTSYLALDINTGYYEHWGEEIIPKLLKKQGYKLSFTQQEIDSMHAESYEQIEVAE
jgi:hypothetical protein